MVNKHGAHFIFDQINIFSYLVVWVQIVKKIMVNGHGGHFDIGSHLYYTKLQSAKMNIILMIRWFVTDVQRLSLALMSLEPICKDVMTSQVMIRIIMILII